jgi:hypothetical protein
VRAAFEQEALPGGVGEALLSRQILDRARIQTDNVVVVMVRQPQQPTTNTTIKTIKTITHLSPAGVLATDFGAAGAAGRSEC